MNILEQIKNLFNRENLSQIDKDILDGLLKYYELKRYTLIIGDAIKKGNTKGIIDVLNKKINELTLALDKMDTAALSDSTKKFKREKIFHKLDA